MCASLTDTCVYFHALQLFSVPLENGGVELEIGFSCVAFLFPKLVFATFLNIASVLASGPPYVLKLWFKCKNWHAACKILLLKQLLVLYFHGVNWTTTNWR